jgi:hypothetical protein
VTGIELPSEMATGHCSFAVLERLSEVEPVRRLAEVGPELGVKAGPELSSETATKRRSNVRGCCCDAQILLSKAAPTLRNRR